MFLAFSLLPVLNTAFSQWFGYMYTVRRKTSVTGEWMCNSEKGFLVDGHVPTFLLQNRPNWKCIVL